MPTTLQMDEGHFNPEETVIPESFPPVTQKVCTEPESAAARSNRKNWVISVIMLLLYVTLGTAAGQLTNLAFADHSLHFRAPYLFTMIKMIFRAQALTFYLCGNTAIKLIRRRKFNFSQTWSRCKSILGEDGLTWRVVLFRFFPPTFFNLAVQVLFTLSMANLSASVATALSAPAVATSYLFSCIFLHQPVLVIKIVFVLVAFTGVGLITYDQFAKTVTVSSVTGIICVLISDLCLSSYQLCFKKAFPKGDFGQVSFAVSGMFLLMCLLFWPVPVILKLTNQEVYDIRLLPYAILFGAWICSSVAAMMYGYGLVLANPFFMSLSELLIMVANTGLDAGIRGVTIQLSQVIGTVLIAIAFLIVVLPDDFLIIANLKRRFHTFWSTSNQQVDTSSNTARETQTSATEASGC